MNESAEEQQGILDSAMAANPHTSPGGGTSVDATSVSQSSQDTANIETSGCRFCAAPLRETFVDLGMSPLCESYLSDAQLDGVEHFYPLHVFVCSSCFLVQLKEYVSADSIFTEYAYFSSYSDSWLVHARTYVDSMIEQLKLDETSRVIEIASNDGYLLQYFVHHGIPVLGIEPAANVARAAIDKGVPTLEAFFGIACARDIVQQGPQADLLIGNNVLAQVPALNDFVAGLKILLAPTGVITMEFPHLMRLIEQNQFDTIYHEHFSYFSLSTVAKILAAHGLRLFDVEELRTHGGSLRVLVCHAEDPTRAVGPRIRDLLQRELVLGTERMQTYSLFFQRVQRTKWRLLEFLIGVRWEGKRVAGYGAPGKGNTLLNYCGIRTDLLEYTVDRNPYKQNKYLPGTHIPIYHPDRIRETKPDYILILPWNLKDEIIEQLSYIRQWGGKFVIPIPELHVLE